MARPSETNGKSPMRVTTDYGEVALDPTSGKYWHLNETATRVLNVMEADGSQEDAVRELVGYYGIDSDQAVEDVAAICAEFQRRGLL